MDQVMRYHPLLVTLHWVLALLITAALFLGLWLAATANTHPSKIGVLMIHMAGGMLIVALMVVRFITRILTSRPAQARTGNLLADRSAKVAHLGFYVLVAMLAATGLATAVLAGLNRIVFQGSGEPLPPDFAAYPTFIAHAALAAILAGLICLHVIIVSWHQFIRRDRLLGRMSFGPRRGEQP